MLRAECAGDSRGPGRVDARAEGRKNDHAPIADLILETFYDNRAIAGNFLGGFGLIMQIVQQVERGLRFQAMLFDQ
jgi:hypothetical protein